VARTALLGNTWGLMAFHYSFEVKYGAKIHVVKVTGVASGSWAAYAISLTACIGSVVQTTLSYYFV